MKLPNLRPLYYQVLWFKVNGTQIRGEVAAKMHFRPSWADGDQPPDRVIAKAHKKAGWLANDPNPIYLRADAPELDPENSDIPPEEYGPRDDLLHPRKYQKNVEKRRLRDAAAPPPRVIIRGT